MRVAARLRRRVGVAGHRAARRARGDRPRGAASTCGSGDIDEGLPFEDGSSFDVVHANQVIEHIRRTDRFLREIRRVLAPERARVHLHEQPLELAQRDLARPRLAADADARERRPDPRQPAQSRARRPPPRRRPHAPAAVHRPRPGGAMRVPRPRAKVSTTTVGYYPLPPRVARLATRIDPIHGGVPDRPVQARNQSSVSRSPSSTRDLRLVAEVARRRAHVRLRVLHVAEPRGLVAGVVLAAHEPADVAEQLVQRRAVAGGQVVGLAAHALGAHREHVALDHVADVGEVARLLAVPVDHGAARRSAAR